jgi:hypothetical protein
MQDKSATGKSKPAEKTNQNQRPPFRRAPMGLDRRQLLHNIPRHVLLAIIFGLLAGPLIFGLKSIPIDGSWRLMLLAPIALVYVAATTLPVALPGKHWLFAVICAVLLLLASLVAGILATKIDFPHSVLPDGTVLTKVNVLTTGAMATGICLGLFYGLLSEKRSAMIAGAILGAATGYTLGMASVELVSRTPPMDLLIYNGALHYAWQLGVALAVLHLGACMGAALGARKASDDRKI